MEISLNATSAVLSDIVAGASLVSFPDHFLGQVTLTAISSRYSAFSAPNELVEGDGQMQTGLAAVGSQGVPKIYFVSNEKILELSANDVAAPNWTTVDVTSL